MDALEFLKEYATVIGLGAGFVIAVGYLIASLIISNKQRTVYIVIKESELDESNDDNC